MGRAMPRYLTRDRIRVYFDIIEGGDVTKFSEENVQEFRCRLEAGWKLRSAEGRHRHLGYATAWVPMRSRSRKRKNRRVRDVEMGSFVVGSRVGDGFEAEPSDSLTFPVDLGRERRIVTLVEEDDIYFRPRMRVVNVRSGQEYQIVDVEEFHSPRGADHWRLMLKDNR